MYDNIYIYIYHIYIYIVSVSEFCASSNQNQTKNSLQRSPFESKFPFPSVAFGTFGTGRLDIE